LLLEFETEGVFRTMPVSAKSSGAAAMVGVESIHLAAADCERLTAVAHDTFPEENRTFHRLLPQTAALARAAASHWNFSAPADIVDQLLQLPHAFSRGSDPRDRTRLRRVAVARLALKFFQVDDRLPESVKRLYPDFFARLLLTGIRDEYCDDHFVKDVRYALGVTIPTGALQFDLNTGVGPKVILRDFLMTGSLDSSLRYATSFGWGRWYGNHLDLRALKEFTPEGWTASFARIAEVLELNPAVRGVAGVSWFYDPEVARISPHLAYVQTPLRYGAFLAKMRTPPHDVDNALVRSPTRKKLYAEGKYVPACYLLAWPRRRLLAWAERLKHDPKVAFAGSISRKKPVAETVRLSAASTAA
jgi:hypothetical protein